MTEFPIYRKYRNERSYFRIKSNNEFDELVKIGRHYTFSSYTAKILPDRVLIEDMIQNTNQHWDDSTAEEFEKVYKNYLNQNSNY